MFHVYRKELVWGGRRLVLETGKIARQADGAVLVTYGDTTVLCTAVAMKSAKPGQDFFPLTVNYQEKTFAAGKIPGGFFKREGRPSEKETLVSRLIDRPLRPLFVPGFVNETQVVCTVLSHDLENDPDIVSMVGASAALTISGIPFLGPIGGARVGYIDGNYVLNPTLGEMPRSRLDLVVAGTSEGVLMVELEAKELSEEIMLGAVTFGHREFQPVIQAIIDLAETCAKEPWTLPPTPPEIADIEARLRDTVGPQIDAAYREQGKQDRSNRLDTAKERAVEQFPEEAQRAIALKVFKDLEKEIVRGAILRDGRRIDGRDTRAVRPISCEVGVLPRAHGSALFTRGETQALAVATLGTGQDEQMIDALEGEYRENFMLHYNFPPYATGESGRLGSPGRREIGHGKLAWRAVRPLLPSKDTFPYTIRVVSEITEFERIVVDGLGVRRFAFAHGCRCPVAPPRGGNCDGADQGAGRVRRVVGYPGRRGPSRRHGFQSSRQRNRDHRAADGHQDHLDYRGDHADRPRSGARRPCAHPRRDGESFDRRTSRGERQRAADYDLQHPEGKDPRGNRVRRQGHP